MADNLPEDGGTAVRVRQNDSVIIRYATEAPDGELVVGEDALRRIVQDLRATEADVLQKNREKKNYRTIAGISTSVLLLVLLANFGLTIATVLLTRQFDNQGGNLVDQTSGRIVRTQSPGNAALVAYQFQGEEEGGGRRLDEECPRKALLTRSAAAEGHKDYLRDIPFLYWQEEDGNEWGGKVMPGVMKTQLGSCDTYVNVRVNNFPDEVVSVTCCEDEESCCVSPPDSATERERLLSNKRAA